MGETIISLLTIVFTLVCVGFLAYVMTKFVGKKSMGVVKSKYMKIIDTLSMGFDRTIYLVKVGEQYVLMYSSTKGFEFICNIDKDKINENNINSNYSENKSFSKYFDFFKPTSKEVSTEEDNNVKINIERLRNTFNNKNK